MYEKLITLKSLRTYYNIVLSMQKRTPTQPDILPIQSRWSVMSREESSSWPTFGDDQLAAFTFLARLQLPIPTDTDRSLETMIVTNAPKIPRLALLRRLCGAD